jgi:hypothetical protein
MWSPYLNKTNLDLLFTLIFPLIIFLAVFVGNISINYLQSLILVFAVPSLYLSLRYINKFKKIAAFSLMVSIPIAIIFELAAFADKSWVVPYSIVPMRLFGLIPFEDFLWQFMTVYFILMFYECFCKKVFQSKFPRQIGSMNMLLYSIAIITALIFFINPQILVIPYAFLWLGIIFFPLPIIIFLSAYPSYTIPFLKVQIFFLYIHMIFELIGLKWNHWIFPSSHYIGWVSLFGQRFPLEEFIFVMCIGAMGACVYYEYFANHRPGLKTQSFWL